MKLNPYLHFAGNCEEALKFYEQVLGARLDFLMRAKDAPEGECPADMGEQVMHASFTVGESPFMASDVPPAHYRKPEGFRIAINIDDPVKAEEVFAALAEGGSIEMPLQKTFWARLFGMATDRFGIPWMFNC